MPEAAGLYVYALVPSDTAEQLGAGIDGEPLLLVTGGRVGAVVHEHHGSPYEGDDEAVRRRVLEHNDVVDRLWGRDHALLPMTFDVVVAGTVDESAPARLRRWLEGVEEEAVAGLDTVRGHVELRVDLALDQRLAAQGEPEVQALSTRIAGERPGVARLLRKRLDQLERDAADGVADRYYPEARARLSAESVDLVENPRATADEGQVLVLSVSLLVAEDAVERVGTALAALAAEQPALRIRFLGPWPPYSFAAMRPGADRARTGGAA